LLPTPEGMFLYKASKISCLFFRKSSTLMLVERTLTPQFISYPTPPGEIIPSFKSNTATPPIGKPSQG